MRTDDSYDVVVVGAGPAGVVHALAVAAQGYRVALVGSSSAPRRGTFELLSGAVTEELSRLALLRPIAAEAARCAGTVFRWTGPRWAEQPGIGWNGGWIVDRHHLDPGLRAIARRRGVPFRNAVARDVSYSDGEFRVSLAPPTRPGPADPALALRAARVVLATGRGSRLPGRTGLATTRTLRQVAITTDRPVPFERLGPRLLVDRAEAGWWYAMGEGTTATVGFVTDVDLLEPGADRLAATWRTGQPEWLPSAAREAPVRGRPSGLLVTAPGRVGLDVIGDAALAVDPLSGHGLALAIRSALRLASDAELYRHWLRERALAYAEESRALYASAEPAHHLFWRRRTGSPPHSDRGLLTG